MYPSFKFTPTSLADSILNLFKASLACGTKTLFVLLLAMINFLLFFYILFYILCFILHYKFAPYKNYYTISLYENKLIFITNRNILYIKIILIQYFI
ncbi:Hypothetical protein CKL_1541 [Clostridium kluyveri DSM 555]|uniref:Uncharacterized protein n=1 Tax=Clostridium kluyveri (strain ATCC 8527 / DSM 555 / NBRC 12016 / NCIMB 10680 / K1) TaxID=431943 RepID=A5N8F2_CLOK5|nr:Hypothetical protein CKL_1541 [Clostridium kluyveri DSM 555]